MKNEKQVAVDKLLTKIKEEKLQMTQGQMARYIRCNGIPITVDTLRKYIRNSTVEYKDLRLAKGEMRRDILAKSDEVVAHYKHGNTINGIVSSTGISRQSVIKLLERAGCKID